MFQTIEKAQQTVQSQLVGYQCLTSIDPDRPSDTMTRLMVSLENKQGSDMLLDLLTNNDSFIWVLQVVRSNFPASVTIFDSWEVTDCPF